MYRGRHQHALAEFARQLKDRPLHQMPVLLVQQAVFAAAGYDRELMLTDHVVQGIAVYPGGVHHRAGLKNFIPGGDLIQVVPADDACHRAVQEEFHPVLGGVLCQGDGHAEGTDNGAGGGVQSRHRLRGQSALQGVQLVSANNAQTLHAVFLAPLPQLLQPGQVLLVKAQHQGAVTPVGKVQLPAEALHHAAARHIEVGFFRSRHGVEAGVYDGGVGLAGACAHILVLFAQGQAQVVAAQLPGCGAAHGTAADDNGVIDHDLPLLYIKKATQTHAQAPLRVRCMTQILIAQYFIIYVS